MLSLIIFQDSNMVIFKTSKNTKTLFIWEGADTNLAKELVVWCSSSPTFFSVIVFQVSSIMAIARLQNSQKRQDVLHLGGYRQQF